MEKSYYERNKAKYKLYYQNNKNKLIEYQKDWIKNNLERQLWLSAKARARKSKIKFSIKIEDIFIPEFCPILEVPLVYNSDYAPSVDRKIPELGYTKENVWVISKKANVMKNNASSEDLKNFGKWCVKTYS